MQQQAITATVFFVYLSGMLGIGVLAWRRTRDLSDYILGGRALGGWVAALSAGASDMSGWLLLGLPGFAYAAGLQAGWIALGLLVGTALNWTLVAARLRVYSELAGDALTLPAFFERRFRDHAHGLRVLSAAFILLFFLFYTSSGLVAGGKLFHAVFGMPYAWAVAVGTLAVLAYVFLGGFLAVSWTDVVQGLLMALALVLVPVVALSRGGGFEATLAAVRAVDPALLDPFSDAHGGRLSVLAIVSLLGWGLGYFGQPHILARFKAVRSTDELPGARRIAVAWVSIGLFGALGAGLCGIALLGPRLQGGDAETVFIQLVSLLFHPAVAAVCLAAILAAIMSTADSQLLVSGSVLAEDFYKALLRPQAAARELVWVGRAAVLAIAAAAFVIALDPQARVLELVAYAWAGFGAAFGPALILALFWQRMTRAGAYAGILAGGSTVVVWKQLSGGWFDLYELVPGFVVSFLAIVLVSRLTPHPGEEIRSEFDAMRRATR